MRQFIILDSKGLTTWKRQIVGNEGTLYNVLVCVTMYSVNHTSCPDTAAVTVELSTLVHLLSVSHGWVFLLCF